MDPIKNKTVFLISSYLFPRCCSYKDEVGMAPASLLRLAPHHRVPQELKFALSVVGRAVNTVGYWSQKRSAIFRPLSLGCCMGD